MVLIVSGVIAASIAAASAEPVSLVGVVPFVIVRNLQFVVSEVIQSEGWSNCGARIRRNQTTSLVAAGRGGFDEQFLGRKHVAT
jgi:hypothetical protein